MNTKVLKCIQGLVELEFLIGGLTFLAINCLLQDIIGKDRIMKFWVDSPWMIPIEIITIIVGVGLYLLIQKIIKIALTKEP